MKYVYPAILYPDDGMVSVKVPDLPGCFTYGEDTADALVMAKDAVEGWLAHAEQEPWPIPAPSQSLKIDEGETIHFIAADTDEYRLTLQRYIQNQRRTIQEQ